MQLEPLDFEEKANRRYKNATPTKLYSTAEVSDNADLLVPIPHMLCDSTVESCLQQCILLHVPVIYMLGA